MTDIQPSNIESGVPFDDLLSLVEKGLLKSEMDIPSFIVTILDFWTSQLAPDDEDGDGDDDKTSPTQHNSASGGILSVYFENFRGQPDTKFRFGSGLNVLSGRGHEHNTVLVALLIGLGCMAQDLAPTYMLKRFISEPLSTCSISVVLENTGTSAYMPSSYGDKIRVIRTIGKKGGSSYEVCSETGMVISKSQSTIDKILQKKSLLIYNPFFIATEEKISELHTDLSGRSGFDWAIQGALLSLPELNLEKFCVATRKSYWKLNDLLSELDRSITNVHTAEKALKAFEKAQAKFKGSEASIEDAETKSTLTPDWAQSLLDFKSVESNDHNQYMALKKEVEAAEEKRDDARRKFLAFQIKHQQLKVILTQKLMTFSKIICGRVKEAEKYYEKTLLSCHFHGYLKFDYKAFCLRFTASQGDRGDDFKLKFVSTRWRQVVALIVLLSIWKVTTPKFCAIDGIEAGMDSENKYFSRGRLFEQVEDLQTQFVYFPR